MEDSYFAYDNEQSLETVKRYKQMLKEAKTLYFDVHEFEMIVEHYRSENRTDAALYAIDIALKQHPNTFLLKQKRAEILLEKGNIKAAFPLIKELLQHKPKNAALMLLLGSAYNMSGQPQKARSTFEAVLDLQTPIEQQNIAYTIGINFERHQQFDNAVYFLEKALKLGLRNEMIYYDLGFCAEKLNDVNKSISYYLKYINDNPYAADAWYNLGIAYGKNLQAEKAAEAYEYALAINPSYPSAVFNLGNSLSSLNRFDEAIKTYYHYLEMDQDSEEAYLYIGQCYDQKEEPETAKKYYLKALSIDDAYADAYYALALNCFIQQELKDSLFYVKKAIKLNNEVADFWFAYANIELYLGVIDKAIHAYEKTVELDPNLEEAWLNLSEIFYNSGQYDVAANLLEKGYGFNYEKAALNFRLAAYLLLLENDKGMQHLEEGMQIDKEKLEEFTEWYPAHVVDDEVKQLLKLYKEDQS